MKKIVLIFIFILNTYLLYFNLFSKFCSLSPSVASALNPATVSAQTQSANATGMLSSSGTPASYLYHAAAAYGGNPLISLQHHPHQSAGLSTTSPALAAALAAQQANASQHLQFYDTTGATAAGYHHHTQVSSAGQTAGTGTPAHQSSVNAGLSSAANVVRFQSKDRSNLYFFFCFPYHFFSFCSCFDTYPPVYTKCNL